MALEAAQAEIETMEQQERQCHRDYSKLQLELQDELWIVENWLWYSQSQIAWLRPVMMALWLSAITSDWAASPLSCLLE